MELGSLKPLLASLILPPALPLLIAVLGVVVGLRARRAGVFVALCGIGTLWLLSCNAVAVWLAHTLIERPVPTTVTALRSGGAQAIVVLGGGVEQDAPEYGEPQLSPSSAARLRYGVKLAQRANLPLAFTGGRGWAAPSTQTATEAEVAQRTARADYGHPVRWLESESRDTRENARLLAQTLQDAGVRRIALVTNAWHMPRAQREFEAAGLFVLPAPMGYVLAGESPVLEWLPSADGVLASRRVLREWIALRFAS